MPETIALSVAMIVAGWSAIAVQVVAWSYTPSRASTDVILWLMGVWFVLGVVLTIRSRIRSLWAWLATAPFVGIEAAAFALNVALAQSGL